MIIKDCTEEKFFPWAPPSSLSSLATWREETREKDLITKGIISSVNICIKTAIPSTNWHFLPHHDRLQTKPFPFSRRLIMAVQIREWLCCLIANYKALESVCFFPFCPLRHRPSDESRNFTSISNSFTKCSLLNIHHKNTSLMSKWRLHDSQCPYAPPNWYHLPPLPLYSEAYTHAQCLSLNFL